MIPRIRSYRTYERILQVLWNVGARYADVVERLVPEASKRTKQGQTRSVRGRRAQLIFSDNSYYFRNALVRANYTNIPKGVHPTLVYLERFFANLLLGENNELKSRYLLVGLHDELESLVPSSREQVGEQVREQVANALPKGVARLLKVLKGEMSVLDMMMALKLGGRRNFLEKYLTPATELGLVEMTQPNSPRSPTQKYRLTPKGLAVKGGV